MLKKEIIGILKDKRTFLIILLVLIIPIIDLSVEYKQMNVAYARKHEKEIIARDLMMKKMEKNLHLGGLHIQADRSFLCLHKMFRHH